MEKYIISGGLCMVILILRDNNKTRKRTRHEHFPNTKYNKPINKK